ncbi:MAG: hypothetical protein H6719_07480 [Sandaracinaceae bacterium]|nr:hypothetical protein [Sandaracinaceae bacterium]
MRFSVFFPTLAVLSALGCVGSLEQIGGDAGGPILFLDGGARPDAGALPDDGGASTEPDATTTGVDAGPPAVDAGPSCPAGQTLCGAACVDTSSDATHCGRCGQPCAPGGSCVGGFCEGGVGCPPAPAGVDPEAAAALERTNEVRTAMGDPCMAMSVEINLAAERHCAYYVANRGVSMCTANAHGEVMGCDMFVAERFDGRMRAAGYSGVPVAENMHFIGNGASAVQGWIDSVYHRNPVLRPWIGEMGYGRSGACDTSDYGGFSGADRNLVLTYPYPAQRDVPLSFDGRREGPNPPAPTSGWPSGYPVTIFAQGDITTHRLTVDGSETDLPHVWLYPGHPDTYTLLRQEYVLYAEEPLTAGTTYRVRAEGTTPSREPFTVDFTFTTR